MSEAKNSEIGEPIDRPSIYRTLLIAFVIWSAHFAISYAGVLVFPDAGIARIIAIGAAPAGPHWCSSASGGRILRSCSHIASISCLSSIPS